MGGAELQRRRGRLLVGETGRANRLLIDFARIEQEVELNRTEVDLAGLVDAEIEWLSTLAPDLPVEHLVHAWPCLLVVAHPGRITQVLHNLVDNARRHTMPGERLQITTDHDDERA